MPTRTAAQHASQATSPWDDTLLACLDYFTACRGYSAHTVKAYARDLREFCGFLPARHPAVESPAQVQRQMVVRYGLSLRGAAPLTVRRKLAGIASFLGLLEDTGRIARNPARGIPLPEVAQSLPECLTEEQARRLLEAAHTPWHRAMVALLLCAGRRRSEAAAITLGDLDLDQAQLVAHGKGVKQRTVALAPPVVHAIREYVDSRPATDSDYLFVSRTGGQPIVGRVVNQMLVPVLQQAELDQEAVTPHTLRRTFATHLIRQGGGHEDHAGTARPCRSADDCALLELGRGGEAGGGGEASLRLLDGLAPDRVTIPLFCAMCRAPLGPSDFTLHATGDTGLFKTATSALLQARWGRSSRTGSCRQASWGRRTPLGRASRPCFRSGRSGSAPSKGCSPPAPSRSCSATVHARDADGVAGIAVPTFSSRVPTLGRLPTPCVR